MSDAMLIMDLIDERISDNNTQMFTGFPARVLEYDNQICAVKPVVRFRYRDGDTVEVGRIDGVPVKFPSGGGVITSYPLKAGDTVWIDCSMVAIDDWLNQYQEVLTPSTRRTHALTDATAYPCIYSQDRRLGVSNENFETVFHKVNEETGLSEEILSKIVMTPEGTIHIEAINKEAYITIEEDSSINIVSDKASNSVKLLANGDVEVVDAHGNTIKTTGGLVEVTSSSKISLTNGSEEVVSLLHELAALLGNAGQTTTKVGSSEVPLTNAAAFAAIASRINSLKA